MDIISLLVIHPSESIKHFVKELLEASTTRFAISTASTLADALSEIQKKKFHLIITSLSLPDSYAIDTLMDLQKETEASIIVLEEPINEEMAKRTIRMGAQDYLLVDELEKTNLERMLINALERDLVRNLLRAQSFTDELTGVYNRRGFFTLFEQQYSFARRNKKGLFLFLVDLDFLKTINDTYGHIAGDTALKNVAACLKISFRSYDIIGRIGGDEFAILTLNAKKEDIDILLGHVQNYLNNLNKTKKYPFHLSFSMGLAYYDGSADISIEDLIETADAKLYEEKKISHLSAQGP